MYDLRSSEAFYAVEGVQVNSGDAVDTITIDVTDDVHRMVHVFWDHSVMLEERYPGMTVLSLV